MEEQIVNWMSENMFRSLIVTCLCSQIKKEVKVNEEKSQREERKQNR